MDWLVLFFAEIRLTHASTGCLNTFFFGFAVYGKCGGGRCFHPRILHGHMSYSHGKDKCRQSWRPETDKKGQGLDIYRQVAIVQLV